MIFIHRTDPGQTKLTVQDPLGLATSAVVVPVRSRFGIGTPVVRKSPLHGPAQSIMEFALDTRWYAERHPKITRGIMAFPMDFAEATRPLLGHLVSIARRILGDEDAAWDAVQEALVSLWLEDTMPSNLRSWLARTVTHRSLHLARCQLRRRKHETQARVQRTEESDRDDPADHLETEDLGRILQEALARIASEQRTVLVLSVVEQMDYGSIASELQIPIGTVRSRMNRARRALRELLIETLPEEYHIRPSGRPDHS
jgi:RNA polymerase sigma factor (sigma-70 family)